METPTTEVRLKTQRRRVLEVMLGHRSCHSMGLGMRSKAECI